MYLTSIQLHIHYRLEKIAIIDRNCSNIHKNKSAANQKANDHYSRYDLYQNKNGIGYTRMVYKK